MYYLKYRPKTISEIDNSSVKERITKILQSSELPHALLFVGPKGTGKTSLARIFAKTINCLENKGSIEPCNHCSNCLNIDVSSSPDVLELDAASNRGINEIKELIKEASFLPMTTNFRVFIIDEAHMITHDGFNALLKTLEEPPKTVVFVLATTNQEKLPKTITSRCQIIQFGKAKKDDLKRMLKRIILAEKLSVGETVIDLIIVHAEHSFRDAAKLLEELVIQKKLSPDIAKQYLGLSAKDDLLETIASGSLKDSLIWIENFSQQGGDFKNLVELLLDQLHDLLLFKIGVISEAEIGLNFNNRQIISLIKLLNEAYVGIKNSPLESLPLEIAIVEFYNYLKPS